MAVGIKIVGCSEVRITDCGFSGLDGGIDVEDSSEVHLSGNRFDRVKSPVKARRVKGLVAKGNIEHSAISETVNGIQMTLIAYLVKSYITNLKGN
ncbi:MULTISPECIES: hypothetical protein [Aeromonas]|uniref:hypothetical protein n=1 Tax=Aeromonas TaxID=642 RepID=UPI0011162202|nr:MULTISPECIES: hypothetical protein [Aeromonas]QWZ78422.1 hypothetical protein I6L49_05515 [Aeromonas sp. FDAARGOS 1419]